MPVKYNTSQNRYQLNSGEWSEGNKSKLFFIEHMSDKDQYVRWVSAECLKMTESERAIPHLVKAPKDRSHLVKSVAVEAMGTFGDERALKGLEHILTLKSIQKDSPGMISDAKEAIKSIKSRRSKDELDFNG